MYYPLCKKLNIIRKVRGVQVVSTYALHEAIGGKMYAKAPPHFRYTHQSGPTPESVEAFLETLK